MNTSRKTALVNMKHEDLVEKVLKLEDRMDMLFTKVTELENQVQKTIVLNNNNNNDQNPPLCGPKIVDAASVDEDNQNTDISNHTTDHENNINMVNIKRRGNDTELELVMEKMNMDLDLDVECSDTLTDDAGRVDAIDNKEQKLEINTTEAAAKQDRDRARENRTSQVLLATTTVNNNRDWENGVYKVEVKVNKESADGIGRIGSESDKDTHFDGRIENKGKMIALDKLFGLTKDEVKMDDASDDEVVYEIEEKVDVMVTSTGMDISTNQNDNIDDINMCREYILTHLPNEYKFFEFCCQVLEFRQLFDTGDDAAIIFGSGNGDNDHATERNAKIASKAEHIITTFLLDSKDNSNNNNIDKDEKDNNNNDDDKKEKDEDMYLNFEQKEDGELAIGVVNNFYEKMFKISSMGNDELQKTTPIPKTFFDGCQKVSFLLSLVSFFVPCLFFVVL